MMDALLRSIINAQNKLILGERLLNDLGTQLPKTSVGVAIMQLRRRKHLIVRCNVATENRSVCGMTSDFFRTVCGIGPGPSCGNRTSCGTHPSCESYIYLPCDLCCMLRGGFYWVAFAEMS